MPLSNLQLATKLHAIPRSTYCKRDQLRDNAVQHASWSTWQLWCAAKYWSVQQSYLLARALRRIHQGEKDAIDHDGRDDHAVEPSIGHQSISNLVDTKVAHSRNSVYALLVLVARELLYSTYMCYLYDTISLLATFFLFTVDKACGCRERRSQRLHPTLYTGYTACVKLPFTALSKVWAHGSCCTNHAVCAMLLKRWSLIQIHQMINTCRYGTKTRIGTFYTKSWTHLPICPYFESQHVQSDIHSTARSLRTISRQGEALRLKAARPTSPLPGRVSYTRGRLLMRFEVCEPFSFALWIR